MSRNVTTNGIICRSSENNASSRTLTAGGNGIVVPNGDGAAGNPTGALDTGTQLTINGLTVGRGAGGVAANTAVGASALAANTTGNYNTATGYFALYSNTTGNDNTATGKYSLYYNTTGNQNTATGRYALYSNTTGIYNTATGSSALYSNTTGNQNTATGRVALYANTTGNYNAAIGYEAGKSNTTGAGNVVVGSYSAAGAYAPAFDCTTEDNRVSIGSTATTNAYIQVPWTVLSDARDKTAVVDLPVGLDEVLALRPVQYQSQPRGGECDGKNRFGFIAQEVAETALGAVVVDAENPDKLRMTNEYLIPVLVKAVQQLTARVAELEKSHA